ncbi:hypothetical protein LUQ84_002398 [Hamiltosporidium tvaerminnensis]|nr:hypothetical protein LUQ84_002398 [Hamiltosporidium tvaerminnensis]
MNYMLKNSRIKIIFLKKDIKEIVIENSKITSGFLTDVFNVDGLESLEISFSDLFIENKICDKNESVKYFRFTPKNIADYHYVYELINIMVCLKEVYFDAIVNLKLSRSVTRIFYITELYLRNVGRTMYFLKLSENNQNFDFRTTNEDNLDSECVLYSLKALFRK